MIRPATTADVPAISRLIRELAEYEKLSHEVVFEEEKLHQHLFGPKPFAEVLIVETEGLPVGFALFFHNYSTFLGQPGIYLEDLYVQPAYRSKGFGKQLLAKLAELALERGCGRLEWAVLNWNKPAIGFYESLGAKPNSEWTVYRLTGTALKKLGTIPHGTE
ncbi:MAG TPA: GNAT family N-acetyltransferase [Gemmatales bacterium]|nr:GNAT family N-acetyltransferase [Gemmatales bacterium]HMP15735.1 GNAT family N-acetyltransferase [Gemmatales bacterium]